MNVGNESQTSNPAPMIVTQTEPDEPELTREQFMGDLARATRKTDAETPVPAG
jgi:hypothetical protein